MSMVQRQVIMGVFISLILFLLISAGYLMAFPLEEWSDLWNRDILDIPFIFSVPSVSIAIGIIFGLFTGINWRRQLQIVDQWLHELEEGRSVEVTSQNGFVELESISKRIAKIQKQMTEQVKLSQKLATEKVEGQENQIQEIISQERNRLARELHDSVSQQLFAASMLMSAINETKTESDDRESKQLKLVEEMIHQSQLEMRALLLHLRPVALKGKTLQNGMKELLNELAQKVSLAITWKIEETSLDKGVEDHLFRILQESVSNTLRHAKASKLDVLLIERDDFIILRVADDGIGFDVENRKAGSYGLQNIYERALEIGGTIKIISLPNKGTRLEVKIPRMLEGEESND
ncbi:sensor histidine kinase [Bacillus sp. DNRA2]|uniref:sensor histidine kinase n=1 Tax=Bacillus sp. DNRA2 TaxID=2723053 RepID=UPI00145C5B12|nr:sensor histidine kinase [Bacillus sp. DNRA2]NMD69751.1 sensor histidine kinase [Bacillus sp. DNRA2]